MTALTLTVTLSLRDDVLRRHIHRDSPQADAHQLVDEGNDDDDAGAVAADQSPGQPAPAEDDGPFIFPEHVKSHENQHQAKDAEAQTD